MQHKCYTSRLEQELKLKLLKEEMKTWSPEKLEHEEELTRAQLAALKEEKKKRDLPEL